ncbi:MAG: hypothetical protein D6708_00395 [Candidatus Dadabacteria bacterium]|nr:MAG: hypothetical protein D6708_00395 [Candidatus Dadabacteria bacterium]
MDWNVVATVQEGRFARALDLLGGWGRVEKTGYYNVLVLAADEPRRVLEELTAMGRDAPGLVACLARVVPADTAFDFGSAEEFRDRSREAVLRWVDALEGRTFHVRMHRRGHKKRLSSQEEEQRLDAVLLEALAARGRPGRVTFDDPDFIVAVETVGGRAGLSLWGREERRAYPLLGLD